ncbi:MAG: hypothetical protein IJ971_11130 [Bacteroidales bacterium]|nr:hypothetical protein [Bacteroidales bacterium]
MQKIINIIIKTALAIIAAVLATGCFFEKMDMPKDLQNVLIQINVSADDLQTRSVPTDREKNIEDLHIYAFNGDDLAGYEYISGSSDEAILMDMVLPEGENVPVQFYLIANASSMMDHNDPMVLSEDMTKDELEAIRYTGVASNSPLPLYCKETKSVNTTAYTENEAPGHEGHLLLVEKVNFKLSRSLAKLSVYGARPTGSTSSTQIISVSMLAGGTREYSYLYPQTDETLNNIPSRANDMIILAEGSSVELGELSGNGSEAAHYTPVAVSPVYLSEVAVGGTVNDWAIMTSEYQVTLKVEYVLTAGGAVKTGFIYMPRIERNMHYKVCILVSEEDEGKIHITYEVADWNVHEMPDYTFTYPSHSYLRSDVPTSSGDTDSPGYAAEMSLTSPFEGYFQLTAPDNDEWQPTLLGNHASDADIKVYDYETGDEVPMNTWPIEASPKWYRIEVIPHTDLAVGNTVDFAITYQPDLVTASEYLLINGSSGNYYWPNSTDANFVTITMVN